jgi:chromosomal replication initiation ATPase DnaA
MTRPIAQSSGGHATATRRPVIDPAWREACAALCEEDLPSMRALALAIARKRRIGLREMKGMRKQRYLILARREFYYRAARELGKSFAEIGRFLGDRDHTTVAYGVRKYDARQ